MHVAVYASDRRNSNETSRSVMQGIAEVDEDAQNACLVFIARAIVGRDEVAGREARRAFPLSKIVNQCSSK